MDESTSSAQLKEEIAALTKSVAQLETEISQTPEPLRKSATRTISLGRFHKVKSLFSNWNEDWADILKDSKPVPNFYHHESNYSTIGEGETPVDAKEQDDDEPSIFRMSEDGDSVLITSIESFLTTSKDSISPSESAVTRILGVLESYLHNLQDETLATGWDSDGKVTIALKNLVENPDPKDPGVHTAEKHGADGYESLDLRKLSDEEGVIYEVNRYSRALLESGDVVAESVLETTKEILKFGRQ